MSMRTYYDYKNPPADTNDVQSMLKYFGCLLVENSTSTKGLSGRDSSSSLPSVVVSVFDKNRLPKLSCPKKGNPLADIVLSYPGPVGYGLQQVSFPADQLIVAVNSFSKYGIPFSVSLPNCGKFPSFILSNFVVNPTIIKRVYYHKRGVFKLPLQPSVQKINRNLNRDGNNY